MGADYEFCDPGGERIRVYAQKLSHGNGSLPLFRLNFRLRWSGFAVPFYIRKLEHNIKDLFCPRQVGNWSGQYE